MDEIVTARLRLRRARMSDLPEMHAVLSNPEATRYWSTLPHESIEETRAWLDSMIQSPPELSDDFVIERVGRVIGKAGFYRVPEIGFILHPDHWGQGLAYEAVSVLVPRAFDRFDVPVLTADIDPRNRASQRLLAKLGFREVAHAERTYYIGGAWHDSIYMELKRPRPDQESCLSVRDIDRAGGF
ncbi:GNAT family N-acetyltransferase [soil metagenome]